MASLKQFLGGEADPNGPALELGVQEEEPQPPRKHRRMSSDSRDSASSSASDFVEDIANEDITHFNFSYQNGWPGVRLVVGYEEDFYVGEIHTILHDKSAVANFMERCCIKDDAYKWPQVQDQVGVESKFVIMSDFEMSSRIWTLDDAHSVRPRFNAYKQMYFL